MRGLVILEAETGPFFLARIVPGMTDAALDVNDRYRALSLDAGQTDLPYDFPLLAEADLTVIRERGGELATLTEGVDFIFPLGLGSDAGGTAQLVVAAQADDIYHLVGIEAIERVSEFMQQQGFDTDKLDADIDKLTRIAQEARRDIDRSLKVAFGDQNLDPLPVPEAGMLVRWRQDLKGFENAPSESQSLALAEAEADRAVAASAEAQAAAGETPDYVNSWQSLKTPGILRRSNPRFLMPEMYIGLDLQLIYCPGGNPTNYGGSTDFLPAFEAMHQEAQSLLYDNEWPPTGVDNYRMRRHAFGVAMQPGHRYRVSGSVPMWGIDSRGVCLQAFGATIVADYAADKAVLDLLGCSGWSINNLKIESDNENAPNIGILVGRPGDNISATDMQFNDCYIDGWFRKAGLYNFAAEVFGWRGGEIHSRAIADTDAPAMWIDSRNTLDVSLYSSHDAVTIAPDTDQSCVQHTIERSNLRAQCAGVPGTINGALRIDGQISGSVLSTRKVRLNAVYVTKVGSAVGPRPAVVIGGQTTDIDLDIHGEVITDQVYYDTSAGDVYQRGHKIRDHNSQATNAIINKSTDANALILEDAEITIYKASAGGKLFDPANLTNCTISGAISVADNDTDLLNFAAIKAFNGDLSLDALASSAGLGGIPLESKVRLIIGNAANPHGGYQKLGVKTVTANGALAVDDAEVVRLAGNGVTAITSILNGFRYAHRFSIVNDQTVACSIAGLAGGLVKLNPGDVLTVLQYDNKFFAAAPTQAGTYTPMLTNVANIDGSTAGLFHWLRVGANVFCSGSVTIDPTAAAATTLAMSLPIAADLTATGDVSGGATTGTTGQVGAVSGGAASDTAQLTFIATNTVNVAWQVWFMYAL